MRTVTIPSELDKSIRTIPLKCGKAKKKGENPSFRGKNKYNSMGKSIARQSEGAGILRKEQQVENEV